MHYSGLRHASNRAFEFICLWIIPIGFFLLLCDLFFLPGRPQHHKLYYALFSIPTLIAICLRPRELRDLLHEPLILSFLAFLAWSLISLFWSPLDESIGGLIKPPLHTLMLFIGCVLLVRYRSEYLQPLFFGAAVVALIASLFNLYAFAKAYSPDLRMIGAGAFDNPLLSSHVFGFFCIYWLSLSMTCKRRAVLWLSIPALIVMFTAVMATGSRTPLVALALATLWLCFVCWNRRSLFVLIGTAICAAIVVFEFSGIITARGGSYRFELWKLALEQIAHHPWIGKGLNASLSLDVGVGYLLEEPHSFALGVLYYVGIIGFIPWLFMQAWALLSAWRQRAHPLFIIASTWLVFGMGAGLTEGGGILSRPKEHWYLLVIPLALIAALNISRRSGRLPGIHVEPLTTSAMTQLADGAHVVEKDGLGPKVLRLSNGHFLKLFRPRRWYTSGHFTPYSERFASNSEHLRSLDIPSPDILKLYQLDDGSSAVLYQPLSGQTLRQILQSTGAPAVREALVERFGKFLAQLHDRGIYFRSVHLGNVLLLDTGEFGLIDLADMRILPSPLNLSLRQRNLRHIQRYPEDRRWLFEEQLQALLQGYGKVATKRAVDNMHKHVLAFAVKAG